MKHRILAQRIRPDILTLRKLRQDTGSCRFHVAL